MGRKAEYDFLTWTSFPSSAKLFNDMGGPPPATGFEILPISVTPGAALKIKFKAKQKNVLYSPSFLWLLGWNGTEWKPLPIGLTRIFELPLGTFDWREFNIDADVVPSGVVALKGHLSGGAGDKERPGETWFDDLKIYMDDKLIYENYFSATPRPLKIVPVFNFAETVVRVYQRIRPGIIKPK